MVPYGFIENDRLPARPVKDTRFPMMLDVPGKQTRLGPAAEGFEAEDVLPRLTRRAIAYLDERAESARNGHPFFLYMPLASPHTPILPTAEWRGKSGLNPYGDFVMQTDDAIGQILSALDRHNLSRNTLVIVTSDNGCSPEANYRQLAEHGHNPSHVYRGTKADIFEGGHRIPFIARWPGRVAAGSSTDALICLMDIMATCAELIGTPLPPDAGEDSVSFLGSLLGRADGAKRTSLVHHSINGSFAVRQGRWKLNLCPDSGGWSEPRPNSPAAKALPAMQLYDLETDIGETKNLQAEHPEVCARLMELLESQVENGRSTPGPKRTNTVTVNWKRHLGSDPYVAR